MPRLIDADAMLQKLSRMIDYCGKDKEVNGLTALFQACDAIMDCPTVDAVPVVHGRWEYDDFVSPNRTCSVCGGFAPFDCCGDYHSECTRYCPNCGAKMDGGNYENP